MVLLVYPWFELSVILDTGGYSRNGCDQRAEGFFTGELNVANTVSSNRGRRGNTCGRNHRGRDRMGEFSNASHAARASG